MFTQQYLKVLKILMLIFMMCILWVIREGSINSAEQNSFAKNENNDKTLSPYFFVKSDDPNVDRLPLLSTSAEVNIAGVIANVNVTQVYKNDGERPIEAIYIFPASTRAAVHGMKMTIAERTIVAEIREREQAKKEYEEAKKEGKSASLLEEQRPNVFQMNVANIMPGDIIKVELMYTELLIPTEKVYEFVYPTIVGPRYSHQPKSQSTERQKWVETPYFHEGKEPTYTFNIEVNICSPVPFQEITSPSHKVNIYYKGLSVANIKLDNSEKYGGNRDYILKYRLSGNKIESGVLLYEGEDKEENFFLAMLQPPKRVNIDQIPPREYIFIVDVSGSMNGFPINISKTLLRNIITNLRPIDKFNVLLFAGGSQVLSEESLQATPQNIEQSINLIDAQQGGGGTEILPALKRALALPKTEGTSRTIVIFTDGYVDVETEVFDLIKNNLGKANMFAFGIGSSVNRYIIEGMAHIGMGEPFIVTKPEEAHEEAEKFRQYIQSPLLTQIKLKFDGLNVYDVEPYSIPDLFAERPIIVVGKWKGKLEGKIKLSGYSGKKWYKMNFNVNKFKSDKTNAVLRYLWARHKIMLLCDYNHLRSDDKRIKTIIDLGLKYHLLTPYTSFVAIDTQIRNIEGNIETVKQVLPLPLGVSDLAVGGDGAEINLSGIDYHSKEKKSNINYKFPGFKNKSKGILKGKRESITFIMGEDKDPANSFYSAATYYFMFNPSGRTDYLISSPRSLIEIRDYLQKNKPKNGRPWGIINIVVHSFNWSGLAIPIVPCVPGIERTNQFTLRMAIETGQFKPLSNDIIDGKTNIRIYGCALGRNRELIDLISLAFGGKDPERPIVRAPIYFVSYKYSKLGNKVISTKQSFADYWYIIHPENSSPDSKLVIKEFQKKYPQIDINWQDALSRHKQRWEKDVYHDIYHFPITWTVIYEDKTEIPILNDEIKREEWIHNQKNLIEYLNNEGFKIDDFIWSFKDVEIYLDGVWKRGIEGSGKTKVICIKREIDRIYNF